MKSQALALFSISGIALAACSGGGSSPAGGASNAGADISEMTDPINSPSLDVKISESHGWALSNPISGTITAIRPVVQAAFERVPRAAATDIAGTGTDAENRLQIKKEGVLYASGKTMFGPAGTGTIEELPLRALTMRAEPQRGPIVEQGADGSDPVYTAGAATTGLSATDGVLFHSAEVTEDGLVLKMGGNAIYYDFQRRFGMGEDINDWYGRGPDGERGTADDGTTAGKWDGCYSDLPDATADCTNWIHDDVKVTFGRPSSAPHGHYAWYWKTRIPLPTDSSADDTNLKKVFDMHRDEVRDLGSYELWMTNLARIDKNLEDADGPPKRDDDDEVFLAHAAYGLFLYNDHLGLWKLSSRLTGYHFGFDAFADEDDARTTDLANAVSATFKGTTMAQMVFNLTNTGDENGLPRFPEGLSARPHRVDLRGDIELTASIGGSGGGSISGVISGFELLGPDGTWHPHAAIIDPTKRERLVLTGTDYKTRQTNGVFTTGNYAADGATINADGSYEGGVFLQEWDATEGTSGAWKDKTATFNTYVTTDQSKFRGRFYGPKGDDLSDLETAGHWYLSEDERCRPGSGNCPDEILLTGPAYGSFGAAQ